GASGQDNVRTGRNGSPSSSAAAHGGATASALARVQGGRRARRPCRSRCPLPRHGGRRLMFVVDTNVLVYAANQDSPYHASCAERLDAWRAQAGAWFVTWSIVYEFLRISTHPRVLSKPWPVAKAWEFVLALLEAPGLEVL